MNRRVPVVLVFAVLALAASVMAATIEVSQPVQVTTNGYYERGQSVVYDGTDYWVFYGRSTTVTSNYDSGNPDTHDYEVYYKKASSVTALPAATAAKVVGASNANGYLGETGAAYFGSDVWAFASIDVVGSCSIYGWWTNDGGTTWNEVGPIVTGMSAGQGHHDEIAFGGELWVLEGSGNFTTMHSATPKTGGWSTPLDVDTALTGGMAHFFIDGSDLYLGIYSSGTNYIYKYNSGTVAWDKIDEVTPPEKYDPSLFKVGTEYVFAQAPWASDGTPGGNQYLIAWSNSAIDGSFFDNGHKMVTAGKYGTDSWIDMWPIGFTDNGGTSYLFYTSERNPSPGSEIDGNIWYLEVDWDVSRDHYTYIQEAIDGASASDVVDVASGIYEEQLEISTPLTVDGAGKGVTTVQSPATLSKYFTTSANNYPLIYVHDSDGVTVMDVTVDGLSRGNANYRFYGVAYYNAGGSIDNCEIKDIKDSPISGAQHGLGIYAYTDIATARTLNISDCDVYGYQKNGMALNGADLTVNVDGCVVTGYGPAPLGLAAQNGIQLGSGTAGTIGVTSANTISGNSYVPHDWAATGIMLYGTSGNVQVKNNILTENSECLYCYNTSATIENNTLTVTQAGTGVADYWAMICDPGTSDRRPVQAFDVPPEEAKGGGEGVLTSFSYTVNNNIIDGDDGLYSVGLDIWCGGTDNLTFSGSNNQVSDFDYGVLITEGASGAVTSVNLTSNTVASNVTYGLYNAVTGLVAYSNQFYGNGQNAQDDGASANQWNSSSCPGNYWDDYVSNSGYPGQYNVTGTAGSIDDCPLSIGVTLDPATHLMACGETITYDVNVGSNALDLMGADYKISYDDTKLSLTGAVVGDLLNTGAGEYIFTYQTGTGVIHVNSSHLGTGVNGPGTIAEITFTSIGSTSPASTALTFSDEEIRDSGNQTLPSTWTGATVVIDCVIPTISVTLDAPVSPWTCYNAAPTVDIAADDDYDLDCVSYDIDGGGYTDIACGIATPYTNNDWPLPGFAGLSEGSHTYNFKSTDDAGNESTVASVTFTKDTLPPSAVTDFVATVGHNQIVLDWTNPGGDVDRIYLYRNDWTSYPGYATADPGYPTVGSYDSETDIGVVETYTDGFSNTTRGIYAYRAVVYDCAGNYAAAGSDDYDRATSYYLGDIASSGGSWIANFDGVVDGFDYNPFSGCYWASPPTGSCMEADFGPTIEPNRGNFGIPTPDAYVGFDDLMIFAMNYGNVPPPPAPLGAPVFGVELASAGMAEASGIYRLSLKEISRVDGLVELALVVEGNEAFKGLAAEIEYDGGLEFISAMPSEALLGGSRVLFMGGEVDGVVRVDFAALGPDVAISGNGPVATLSFRRSTESGSSVRITSADARDVDNDILTLEFDGGASIDPGIPAMFALRGNSPNPFAGSTEIRFDVPRDASVSLRIYNIQGQVVQTLVDGTVPAGRHGETWDGLDSQGRKVSAGVYFCEMQSGSFVATSKLMISR